MSFGKVLLPEVARFTQFILFILANTGIGNLDCQVRQFAVAVLDYLFVLVDFQLGEIHVLVVLFLVALLLLLFSLRLFTLPAFLIASRRLVIRRDVWRG